MLGDREFTSEEVAALCGVTRVTVADWIARGKLRVRWTAGGHRRIPRASLAEFMLQQGYALPRRVATHRALAVVIDDEPEWRQRLHETLESAAAFDVERAPPGVEIMLQVGIWCPDALVIDSKMPGFDTRQLIEAIRREPTLAEVTIVALVAHDEEASSMKRYGADAALNKRRLDDLSPTLVRLLTERQRRLSIAPAPQGPVPPRPNEPEFENITTA